VSWSTWGAAPEVEPSLYAADFSRLGEQIDALLAAGARVFHWDVGDGRFVPPITMGPIVLKWISERIHDVDGVIDVHLMTDTPDRYFREFAEAGADSVTVHVEVCGDCADVAAAAREHGLRLGVALNPETSLEAATPAVETGRAELVNCMSVHPGYSGQRFIPESVERVRRLRGLLPADVRIQVDGGVGPSNIGALREAGATLLVAATSIFGSRDPISAYRGLAEAAG
jgi:ribulose-phosphate 3-epimerase